MYPPFLVIDDPNTHRRDRQNQLAVAKMNQTKWYTAMFSNQTIETKNNNKNYRREFSNSLSQRTQLSSRLYKIRHTFFVCKIIIISYNIICVEIKKIKKQNRNRNLKGKLQMVDFGNCFAHIIAPFYLVVAITVSFLVRIGQLEAAAIKSVAASRISRALSTV